MAQLPSRNRRSSTLGSRLWGRAATLAVCTGLGLAIASCGSRTGLFVDDDPSVAGPRIDAGTDARPDGAVSCTPGKFGFDLALTQLMFVIDRSGSMAFAINGDEDVPPEESRWAIVAGALEQTITNFDQQIAMGAKFFPEFVPERELSNPARACQVDTGVAIAPAKGNSKAILDVFDQTEPRGGTPTSEAIRSASTFLRQTRSVARAIVVATDGAPNCNGDLNGRTCVCTSSAPCSSGTGRYSCLDDRRTIDTIREVAEQDLVPVYVIGIGTTEQPAFLDVLGEMAKAGGRPRPAPPYHYSVQSAADLTSALTIIRDSVARCTYLTPSAPTNPDGITVQIDGKTIARDETKTDGWDWVDREFGAIAFFGDACTEAQAGTGPGATVGGVVRCE